MVAPYPPSPPYAGGRRRIFEQLAGLSREHDVDLACLTYRSEDERHLKRMSFLQEIVAVRQSSTRATSELVEGSPVLVRRFWNDELAGRIARLCRSQTYDWMLIEHSYAAPYASQRGPATRVALTIHNVEYRVLEQIAPLEAELELAFRLTGSPGQMFRSAAAQISAMKAFEQDAWGGVELRVVVSPIEQQIVKAATLSGRTILIPNCPSGLSLGTRHASGAPRITFIGALNYLPNVDAAVRLVQEVVPRVRRCISELEVVIAGRDPQPALVEFCAQSGVRVVANPEGLAPLCTEKTVLVAPLRLGGGTRIKLLDALTLGLPAVATPLAAEGLGLVDGSELFLGSKPDELADHVCVLLRSAEVRARLRQRGREFLASKTVPWTNTFRTLQTHLECGAEIANESGSYVRDGSFHP